MHGGVAKRVGIQRPEKIGQAASEVFTFAIPAKLLGRTRAERAGMLKKIHTKNRQILQNQDRSRKDPGTCCRGLEEFRQNSRDVLTGLFVFNNLRPVIPSSIEAGGLTQQGLNNKFWFVVMEKFLGGQVQEMRNCLKQGCIQVPVFSMTMANR
jgi:hypothetical protein